MIIASHLKNSLIILVKISVKYLRVLCVKLSARSIGTKNHKVHNEYKKINQGTFTNLNTLPVLPVGPIFEVTVKYISPLLSCPNPFKKYPRLFG